MKITKIETQIKRKGRYSIFVDDVFAFGISELGLINSRLKVGQELTTNQLKSLKEDAKTDKIYNQALALIARRPRSQWELEQYLKRKGNNPDTIEVILNRLSEKEFIDDEVFARRWVENRRLLKSISKRKLQVELKQKKISDEIIRHVLEEDETDELDVLKAEIIKKRRQSRYQDDQKLIAYLARQGYQYDDIKSALLDLREAV